MADKQIVIKDYFNILRDDYGRIYCIQEIGDPKSLIKAIREQNEYIQAKEQECEELKEQLNQAKYLSEGALRLYSERQKNKYKQVLDEIENFLKTIMETNRVYPLQANLQKVLNIINKVKEQ